MPPAALNLLVFRDGRRSVCGPQLRSAMLRQLAELGAVECSRSADAALAPLLRAGELECGISDHGAVPVRPFAELTDRLATALIEAEGPGNLKVSARELQALIAGASVPEQIAISPPEGFAYYALHPLEYADVVRRLPLRADSVTIIGIRGIGTTLSAIAAAAVRALGLRAARTTVRPTSHPYNRKAELSATQREFVQEFIKSDSDFLVVDEGPGLSGSSFLSVAEALVGAGVPADRITLICGHQPDFNSFRADDGTRRALRFRWTPVASDLRKPGAAKIFIGAGQWRSRTFSDSSLWPASWTAMERLKYLSEDPTDRRIFKFLGLGQYGEEVFEREEQIAHAGFGLSIRRELHGFASYDWLAAHPMSAGDLTKDVLLRLANYCGLRSKLFHAGSIDLPALQQMADHNARQLNLHGAGTLQLERPVIADGRMQPHEWLLTRDGRMFKTDCGSHGDDHFFPGVTDIAWDLAGAIVEWRMNDAQRQFFLESYRHASGDNAKARIEAFIGAYRVFRQAFCLMGANALHGNEESFRLQRAAANYVAPAPQLPVSIEPALRSKDVGLEDSSA